MGGGAAAGAATTTATSTVSATEICPLPSFIPEAAPRPRGKPTASGRPVLLPELRGPPLHFPSVSPLEVASAASERRRDRGRQLVLGERPFEPAHGPDVMDADLPGGGGVVVAPWARNPTEEVGALTTCPDESSVGNFGE